MAVGANVAVATVPERERFSGCLICQQPTGLWSENFCSPCLFGSGYEPTPEQRELVFRALWDAIWEDVDTADRLPYPGDVPPKRAYTGPRSGSLFERVKAGVDLAEYTGRFTSLRRAGRGRLKGACPLHKENTPSFYIYQEKGTWRCYGACATGGDVISLAQARFKLPTPMDAAILLAQEFGIPYGPRRNGHRPKRISVEVSG